MYPDTSSPHTTRNRVLLVLFGLLTLLVLTFAIRSKSSNPIDKLPDEGSSEDYSSQVVFAEGEESRKLFRDLGSATRYDSIGRDLFVFAKENYTEYQNKKGVIGFKITSPIRQENGGLIFSGRYGAINNEIAVSVKSLANGRIKSSVTDRKTNKNIDSSLPSNSRRNQVIGELPLRGDVYYIAFSESTDTFVINIFTGGTKELDIAAKALANKLGIPDLGSEKYSIMRSGSEGVLSPKPVVDNQAGDDYE